MEDRFHVYPSTDFIDLGIYQLGLENCKAGHSFGPASRNHFLFHYVISGKGQLMCPDKNGSDRLYSVNSDQGFLLLPGVVTTYIADNDNPWTYMWVEFDGLKVSECIDLAGFSRDNPVYVSHDDALRDILKAEMLYMVYHAGTAPIYEITGHLYLFLDALMRSKTHKTITPKNRLRNFYIREAISFIEEHYSEDISVEQIASNCGLNRSYFGKIFKDEVGSTPQKFLLNYRMVKASELLRQTDMPISDIAPLVGYPNQLHFSRAFKGIYSLSPRHWRNINKIV